MGTAKARAIRLLQEHRTSWGLWSQRERTNFLRRCRRLARRLDPRQPGDGHEATAVMALDMIATRTGAQVWPE